MGRTGQNEPLRVALLNSISGWGGGEKWCLQTALALRERGHSPLIACAKESVLEERSRAAELPTWSWPVGRVGWRAGGGLNLGSRLLKDHVEAVVGNVGRDMRLGAIACWRSGAKLLQRRGLLRAIKPTLGNRILYQRIERVIVNCRAIQDEMTSRVSFVPPERFFVLPNGVPIPTSSSDGAATRAAARDVLGVSGDGPVVAVIGRLATMKGHAVLLKAWTTVAVRHPDAQLLVIGDGALREELETGAPPSARFLGFRDDLPALYAGIDVLCLPSVRDEGCNNTLLEAMSYGCPALVSACGGLPEIVTEQTGRVVPVGDADALAEALGTLLDDAGLRGALGAAAAERIAAEFSLEAVTDQFEALLRGLR